MFYLALALTGALALAPAVAQEQHPAGGTHHHPEAAKNQNPVKADETSIAAGKQVYEKNCANCHGKTGAGDGAMGAELNPKPSNFTDAEWKHGSSDGEIFAVIKDGVKGTGMKSFNSKLTPHQMWDAINYLRTLAPAKSH
jgi:mono/diheme cytochrome c family protein